MSIENQSDANDQEPVPSEPANDGNEPSVSAEPAGNTDTDDNTPFHEHPRFKELIEEKNQNAQQLREFEERYTTLEQELSQLRDGVSKKDSGNPLISRLKGYDSEFGTWAEQRESTQKAMQEELEGLRDWRQQQETQTVQTQIDQTLQTLHDQNKVSEFWQSRYKNDLNALATQHPERFRTFDQLRDEYKRMHEGTQQYLEDIRRETTKSYVKDKRKDASVPRSQPKGGAASHQDKPQKFADVEEMRHSIAKLAVKRARGDSSL